MATSERSLEEWLETQIRARGPQRPLIRLTIEEQRERMAGLAGALDRMARIENGPDEDDGDFFRALDESHPWRSGHESWY